MDHTATHTKTYRKLVEGTTINTTTLLSTDYLNHYNELVMLLEMVPDMPDMMMEVHEWAPKTYAEHFKDSTFTHAPIDSCGNMLAFTSSSHATCDTPSK